MAQLLLNEGLAGRSSTLTVVGGSNLLAFSFITLACSEYIAGSTQLETSQFLRLWGSTYLAIIVGFMAILGGALLGTEGNRRDSQEHSSVRSVP